MCMPGVHRSQKRVSDALELKSWTVVNDYVKTEI